MNSMAAVFNDVNFVLVYYYFFCGCIWIGKWKMILHLLSNNLSWRRSLFFLLSCFFYCFSFAESCSISGFFFSSLPIFMSIVYLLDEIWYKFLSHLLKCCNFTAFILYLYRTKYVLRMSTMVWPRSYTCMFCQKLFK